MSKQLPDYKVVCLDKSSLDQAMTDGYLMLAVLPGLNEQAPDMALLRLTCHDDVIEVNCATAEQEAAERADLDERLAQLEMARDNLAADMGEMAERVRALENKGRALNVANVALQDAHNGLVTRAETLEADNKELHTLLGQCFGKAEQADGKANVAVDALFGDVDASIKALQASTARLENELAELTQQTSQEQHANDRDYEQQGDRIKQVEDGLRGLRRHVMGQEGRDYGERP